MLVVHIVSGRGVNYKFWKLKWERCSTHWIECFHMTSRWPYWCPKTMKRWPCWCPKPILWELNSFLMQTLSFVPINLHRCWPREWKHSIIFKIFLFPWVPHEAPPLFKALQNNCAVMLKGPYCTPVSLKSHFFCLERMDCNIVVPHPIIANNLCYRFFWKSAPGHSCDDSCRSSMLCRLMTGRSHDTSACTLLQETFSKETMRQFQESVDMC